MTKLTQTGDRIKGKMSSSVKHFNSSLKRYNEAVEHNAANEESEYGDAIKSCGRDFRTSLENLVRCLFIERDLVEINDRGKDLHLEQQLRALLEHNVIENDEYQEYMHCKDVGNETTHDRSSVTAPLRGPMEEILRNLHKRLTQYFPPEVLEQLKSIETMVAPTRAPPSHENVHFILDPSPDDLPPGLPLIEDTFGRDDSVKKLTKLFDDENNTGILVTLTGPPKSGKSTVLGRAAESIACKHSSPKSLAILHVDFCRSSTGRPSRAFFNALSASERIPSTVTGAITATEDGSETEESKQQEIDIINNAISHALQGRRLLTVTENMIAIGDEAEQQEELEKLFDSPSLKRAVNFLEGEREIIRTTGHSVQIALQPFCAEEAIQFLISLDTPDKLAQETVELLKRIGGEALFYPYYFKQGYLVWTYTYGKANESERLVEAIIEKASTIFNFLVEGCCDGLEIDVRRVKVGLSAIAIFRSVHLKHDIVNRTGLGPLPIDELSRRGWFCNDRPFYLEDYARALGRAWAAEILTNNSIREKESSEEPESPRRMLESATVKLATTLLDSDEASTVGAVEEAANWLGRTTSKGSSLYRQLSGLVDIEAVGDSVRPRTDKETREAAPLYMQEGRNGDLDSALAALSLYSQGSVEQPEVRERRGSEFLESAEIVAEIIKDQHLTVSSRQLKGLDMALYHGSRRYRRFEDTLNAWGKIHKALRDQENRFRETHVGRRALSSFLLNLADLCLSVTGSVGEYLKRAKDLCRLNDESSGESRDFWLLARVAFLTERTAATFEDQKKALVDGCGYAARCLELAPQDPRSARFYLRAVRRLVQLLREDEERAEAVDGAKAFLISIFGETEGWPVSIRAQVASLMHYELRRYWNDKLSRERAMQALKLLHTNRSEVRSDVLASLVEARLEWHLGNTSRALVACDRSLKLGPTPAGWLLKLRLLDDEKEGSLASYVQGFATDGVTKALSQKLKDAIYQFEEMIRNDAPSLNPAYGRVMLWVIRRRWQNQGSIIRYAENQYRRNTDRPEFGRLPESKREQLLKNVYNERETSLRKIEQQFGSSNSLTITRFRNEAQYQRSISILKKTSLDADSVLKVLNDAEDNMRGNHVLELQRGEYYRYIWQTDRAIKVFRSVQQASTDGDLRRRAGASLARTLYSKATTLMVGDPMEDANASASQTELLHEAKSIAEGLMGSTEVSDDMAILKDNISLELGETIDWSSLGETYEKIVGDIDGFPNTLLKNFDDIGDEAARAARGAAGALEREFADPERLGLIGMIFLGRAEKQQSNHPDEDLRRALALFRAASLLERSWRGTELPTTSFRIGRTILVAAQQNRNANPIPDFVPEVAGRSQLAYAVSKFNSVVSRTTGEFQKVAKQYQSDSDRLLRKIAG